MAKSQRGEGQEERVIGASSQPAVFTSAGGQENHGQQPAVLPGLRPPLRLLQCHPDRPPQRPHRGVHPPGHRRRGHRGTPQPRSEQTVLPGRRAADPDRRLGLGAEAGVFLLPGARLVGAREEEEAAGPAAAEGEEGTAAAEEDRAEQRCCCCCSGGKEQQRRQVPVGGAVGG
jgi:hypothetical protein